MTTEEKLEKLKKLADAMYYAAQYLTTDASRFHKTMEDYHQFVIQEWHKEEPVSDDLLKFAEEWDESLYRSDAVIAGANWQKKQMMAKAIDATCFGIQGAALFTFRLPAGSYLVGSEVKVIIVKSE